MDTNALLDAVKARLNLPSDYALANHWQIQQSSIRDMRRNGLSDERALQVATLLELPEGEVLASIRAERAKDPAVKAAWKKVAESVRTALGLAAFVAIAFSILGGSMDTAIPGFAILAASPSYTLCAIALALGVWALRRSWRLLGGFALCGLLTACGQDVGAPHETSVTTIVNETLVQCDYRGPTGICVAFADAAAADIPALDYERAYRFVEQCMTDTYGTPSAPGPAVLVYSDLFEVDGQRVAGWTSFSTGLIQVHGFGTLYHEYVHYLLWRAGFPNEANANHEHPAFLTCGARAGFIDG